MLIGLKDGRIIEIGEAKKEVRIRVSITGTSTRRYSFDSFLLHSWSGSKNTGSIDLRRPVVIYGYPSGRHVGEVGYFVAKRFRGTGLSYILLHEISKFAVSKGMKLLLMSTTSDNGAAIGLFRNCGGGVSADFKGVMNKGKSVIWMSAVTRDVIKKSRNMWEKKGVKIVKKQ